MAPAPRRDNVPGRSRFRSWRCHPRDAVMIQLDSALLLTSRLPLGCRNATTNTNSIHRYVTISSGPLRGTITGVCSLAETRRLSLLPHNEPATWAPLQSRRRLFTRVFGFRDHHPGPVVDSAVLLQRQRQPPGWWWQQWRKRSQPRAAQRPE